MSLPETLQKLKQKLAETTDARDRLSLEINIAHTSWMLNKYQESDHYASLALDNALALEDKGSRMMALNQMGLNRFAHSQFDVALQYYARALKLADEAVSPSCVSVTHNNMGQVYLHMNDDEQAERCFQLAVDTDPEHFRAYNNLSTVLMNRGRFSEATELLRKAEKHLHGLAAGRSLVIIHTNLGVTFYRQNDYQNALEEYQKALNISLTNPDNSLIATLLYNMTPLYLELNDTAQATVCLEKAMALSNEIGNLDLVARGFLLSSHLYEKTGDYRQSLLSLRQYLEKREELHSRDMKSRVAEISAALEKERTAAQNAQMMEKAAKMASVGTVASGIMHEINQPLNAISISADSILYWDKQHPGQLNDIARDGFLQISRAVERTREIIGHMRSFWQPDPESRLSPVSVHESIAQSGNLMESQLFAHGIEYRANLTAEQDIIAGIPIYLEHIMFNLIGNALSVLDSLPEGNRRIIDVSTWTSENRIFVRVRDNGPGIPPGDLDRVFEPFYSTRFDKGGTGLGLSLVRHFAKIMKGVVSAENHSEGGAMITLRFNLAGGEQ